MEATCRRLDAGRTEADIAGELAHRLLKRRNSAEEAEFLETFYIDALYFGGLAVENFTGDGRDNLLIYMQNRNTIDIWGLGTDNVWQNPEAPASATAPITTTGATTVTAPVTTTT